MDITDIERRRPVKVAKLVGYGGYEYELRDVHLVWLNEDRITLTGDERLTNAKGEKVNFKQSWLCTLDSLSGIQADLSGPDRKIKPSMR